MPPAPRHLNACILMRVTRETEEERDIAKGYFTVYERRSEVPPGSLVIGRYSVLPYYKELWDDLRPHSRLAQTPREHAYVADLNNYVDHLRDGVRDPYQGLTPPVWRRIEDIPPGVDGPFVLKGKTNSRKDRWLTHMFAADRAAAREVRDRLLQDSFIEEQGVYIRPYWPLKKLFDGVNGMPVVREYRFFVLGDTVVGAGFYWANYADVVPADEQDPVRVPPLPIENAIKRVGSNAVFYVIDVAQREDGSWCVVELNDGQMSGLSGVDAHALYSGLRAKLAQMEAASHPIFETK